MNKKLIVPVMGGILFLLACNFNQNAPQASSTEQPPEPSVNNDVSPKIALETELAPIETESVSTFSYQIGAIKAFDQQQFDAAMADGKTVFLDFYAPWCSTCRANQPFLDGIFDGSGDVVGFRVDYDTAVDLRKKYSVVVQSTYIVFRGGQEVNRFLGALTTGKLLELLGS